MTAMDTALTVGQVAERFGITVRTLHHYDEIGLLVPTGRSAAGYRLYDAADLTRLQHVVVYRRLGLALEDVAALLDDPSADVAEHLRRQRDAVTSRLDELTELVGAIDRALEAHMSGTQLSDDDRRELFGAEFADNHAEYQREAEERWGDTAAWAQSRERTAQYTKADWEEIKAEMDAVNAAFVAAMRAGEPPTSSRAMDAAEQHRQHVTRWFYDMSHDLQTKVACLYVDDERFRKTYEDIEPGLARYAYDAIQANAATRG